VSPRTTPAIHAARQSLLPSTPDLCGPSTGQLPLRAANLRAIRRVSPARAAAARLEDTMAIGTLDVTRPKCLRGRLQSRHRSPWRGHEVPRRPSNQGKSVSSMVMKGVVPFGGPWLPRLLPRRSASGCENMPMGAEQARLTHAASKRPNTRPEPLSRPRETRSARCTPTRRVS